MFNLYFYKILANTDNYERYNYVLRTIIVIKLLFESRVKFSKEYVKNEYDYIFICCFLLELRTFVGTLQTSPERTWLL